MVYGPSQTPSYAVTVSGVAPGYFTSSLLESFTPGGPWYIQGVCCDGDNLYVSYGTGTWTDQTMDLYKYDKTTKALVTSRTGTIYTDDCFYKDGYIYCANVVGPEPGIPYATRYRADTLGDDTVVLDDPARNCYTESLTFYNGHWWIVGHVLPRILKYNSLWEFVKEYPITNSGHTNDGYDGIDFWEVGGRVFFGLTVHDPNNALVIFEYDPSTDSFSEFQRETGWNWANQGLMRDRWYSSPDPNKFRLWAADRFDGPVGSKKIHLVELTWHPEVEG